MMFSFKKNTSSKSPSAQTLPPQLIGTEKTLTVKDLSLCLYEEYEKTQKLRKQKDELEHKVEELEHVKIDANTQLVVIDELKSQIKELERRAEHNSVIISTLKAEKEEVQARAAERQALFEKELKSKIDDEVETLSKKKCSLLVRQVENELVDRIIAAFEEKANVGKKVALSTLKDFYTTGSKEE